MDRFETITQVRERSPDDHAHGVIQVRLLNLFFDPYGSLFMQHGHLGIPSTYKYPVEVAYKIQVNLRLCPPREH